MNPNIFDRRLFIGQSLHIVSLYDLDCEAERYIVSFKAANPDIAVKVSVHENWKDDPWGFEFIESIRNGEQPADIIIADPTIRTVF